VIGQGDKNLLDNEVDIRHALIGGLGQSFGSSIGRHSMQNTHTGGHEGQKKGMVWVKRGLYWRVNCFRARGEYMIRLDRLNKCGLFTAHGRRGLRTPVHTWGGPRPHSYCAVPAIR
jgi:hypothetical protein